MFNERVADNGSPDLQGYGLTKRTRKKQTSITYLSVPYVSTIRRPSPYPIEPPCQRHIS